MMFVIRIYLKSLGSQFPLQIWDGFSVSNECVRLHLDTLLYKPQIPLSTREKKDNLQRIFCITIPWTFLFCKWMRQFQFAYFANRETVTAWKAMYKGS